MIENKIDELIVRCLNLIDYQGQVGVFHPMYVEFITMMESFIKDFNLENTAYKELEVRVKGIYKKSKGKSLWGLLPH